MRIAVAATPQVAIPTLDALLTSPHQLIGVITQPDRAAGRGKEFRQSEVGDWAESHEIPLLKPKHPTELIEYSKSLDCVVTVGYGVLLPPEVFNAPKYGYLNLHFSLLPKWRGAAPVQRAIQAGDKESGVTVFKLNEGMDTGPISVQKSFTIPEGFRSAELFTELAKLGATAVLETLTVIESGFNPVAQIDEGVSKAGKISKDDARLDWNRTSIEVLRDIRAFYPSPIAWTNFRGENLRIENAAMSSEKLTSGAIKVVNGSLFVGTKDGSLEILKLIPAGKKSIDTKSWLNGARITQEDHFG